MGWGRGKGGVGGYRVRVRVLWGRGKGGVREG